MCGREEVPAYKGCVCVSVRNSCKRGSDWFPSFDRHLIPLGRRVGQARGCLWVMRGSGAGRCSSRHLYMVGT